MHISINGTDITDFIKYGGVKWSRNDIDGPNTGRNIRGTMLRDRITTKIRIDVSCRPLTTEEHNMLMRLLMPEYISVNYDDPVYGTTTKVMYSNNHDSSFLIRKPSGREYWDGVSFPLIER